jgi:hypothetical protein
LTVTEAGTVAAAVLLLDRLTTAPPGGAAPFNVTVPVEELPPTTEVGFSVSEVRADGVAVTVAAPLEPLYVAVIVEFCVVATPLVLTAKFALVAPAGTVTVPWTVATVVLLLLREITAPPEGAAPVSDTVPVDALPPTTEAGFSVTELTPGVTRRLACCVLPLKLPEIETDVAVATANVLIGKLADVVPAATATLAGTEATDVLLLDSVTVPPADVFKVTVPVTGFPPAILAGFTVTDVTPGTPNCCAPTDVVGSTAAYWRMWKPVTEAIALPQPNNPTVPDENWEFVT